MTTTKTQTTSTTQQVVNHHLGAFFERDVDGILSDYAPDAVLFTANGLLRGVREIRPLFEAMVAEFEKPGAAFHLEAQSYDGDCAFILWKAETADNVYELGTDTFVVRNGKIAVQSFAGKIVPRASAQR
jgi:ketosteroid isomerase-like protein